MNKKKALKEREKDIKQIAKRCNKFFLKGKEGMQCFKKTKR